MLMPALKHQLAIYPLSPSRPKIEFNKYVLVINSKKMELGEDINSLKEEKSKVD